MFCPLGYRDNILIVRGVIILVIIVIFGVAVTEQQLNSLTKRQDFVSVFNVTYDQSGIYSFYIVGANYQIRAVYPMGEIITSDRAVTLKTIHHKIILPTYLEINCEKELILLDLWAKLVVREAFEIKGILGETIRVLHEKINVYTSQFR